MILKRKIKHITRKIFPQEDSGNRNRAILQMAKDLGFSMPEIRAALVRLNRVDVPSLALGVSVPTLYNTLSGERRNGEARKALAGSLGLRVEELLPEN